MEFLKGEPAKKSAVDTFLVSGPRKLSEVRRVKNPRNAKKEMSARRYEEMAEMMTIFHGLDLIDLHHCTSTGIAHINRLYPITFESAMENCTI